MTFDHDRHHRHSLRLQGYNYSQAGAYFVTLCTKDRVCLLGEIMDGEMRLNDAGRMVQTAWDELPTYYPGVDIDAFVIMPNHIHGVVVLVGAAPCGRPVSGQPRGVAPTGLSLPDVVHRFKTLTTKRYIDGVKTGEWQPFRGRVWQRNYYEHIIRDEASLHGIREYIANNPLQWALDQENPANVRAGNQATTRVAPTVPESIDDARVTVGAGLVPAHDGSADDARATTRLAPTSWGDV